MKLYRIVVALMVMGASACGDPATNDRRGYTKAPLEHPAVVIRGEEPSEMSRLGEPNRVVAEVIELPAQDTAAQPQPAQQPTVQLPSGVTQEMVTQGGQVFSSTTCFTCHGMAGAGGPLGPALNDSEWLHVDGSYDALVQIISSGVPTPKQFPAAMPAKGGTPLTDDQVRQVAAYVYSLSR